jgi:hypothetical protein
MAANNKKMVIRCGNHFNGVEKTIPGKIAGIAGECIVQTAIRFFYTKFKGE